MLVNGQCQCVLRPPSSSSLRRRRRSAVCMLCRFGAGSIRFEFVFIRFDLSVHFLYSFRSICIQSDRFVFNRIDLFSFGSICIQRCRNFVFSLVESVRKIGKKKWRAVAYVACFTVCTYSPRTAMYLCMQNQYGQSATNNRVMM